MLWNFDPTGFYDFTEGVKATLFACTRPKMHRRLLEQIVAKYIPTLE
jgi:hypothetical protein